MGWVLVAAAAAVIATGTVVTGAGPHGGDENVQRLGIAVTDAARIHGITENVFLVLVLVTLWLLSRTAAPAQIRHNGNVLLAVLFGQATVGYIQYFSGVPVVLVAVHIVGAVVVWSATLFFVLGLRVPEAEPVPERELVELRG
jgi:cytochrome c oxidase assembly protein subunit 15